MKGYGKEVLVRKQNNSPQEEWVYKFALLCIIVNIFNGNKKIFLASKRKFLIQRNDIDNYCD